MKATSPYASHTFLRVPVAIPYPLPPERINVADSNCALHCAACGNPIGCDLHVPLETESVAWGKTTRTWVTRVCLCYNCWRGRHPTCDPASLPPAKLKALILSALSERVSKTPGKLAADAGLRNTQYLHDVLCDLRDEGEVTVSRGADFDGQPVWRLASA